MVRAKSQFRGRLEHIVRHRKPPRKHDQTGTCATQAPSLRRSSSPPQPRLESARPPNLKVSAPEARPRPKDTNSTAKAGDVSPPRPCIIRPGDVRELQASGIWRSDVRGLHDASKRPSTSAQLHQPSSPALNRQQQCDRFIPAKSNPHPGNTPAM